MGEIGIKKKLLLLIILSNSASGNIFLTDLLTELKKRGGPDAGEKIENFFRTYMEVNTSAPEKSECPLLNDQQDSNSAPSDHSTGYLSRPHFQTSFMDESENLNSTTDFKCFKKCCRFSKPNVQKKCFKRHGCGKLTNENFCYKRRFCFEKCCKEDPFVNLCLYRERCPSYTTEKCKKYLTCWKNTIPKKCYEKSGMELFRAIKRKCGAFVNYPNCQPEDICEFTKKCINTCCKDGFDRVQKTQCLVNNDCPTMLRRTCGMRNKFNRCKEIFAPICCERSPILYESCLRTVGCHKFLMNLPRSETCEGWNRCSNIDFMLCCVQKENQYNSCLDSVKCGKFKKILKPSERCRYIRWCVDQCCYSDSPDQFQNCVRTTGCDMDHQYCEWRKYPMTFP